MSQNADRTLMQWAELWTAHDIDRLLALFTEDCIYEDVAFALVNHGKRELRLFAQGMLAAFPDLRVELKSHFAAESWGAMEWIMSGTHEGDLPGMAATHKKFSLRGATVAELNEARIKRLSDYFDLTTFLKQIGLMPGA